MSVMAGGLAGAMGSLSLDVARSGVGQKAAAVRSAAATGAPAPQAIDGGFQPGLLHARAVAAPVKAQSAMPPPNPNLPRGSLIDLKV